MCRSKRQTKKSKNTPTTKIDVIKREMEVLEEIHEMYEDMIDFNHKLEKCLVKRMDFMQNKIEEYEKLKKIDCKNEERR